VAEIVIFPVGNVDASIVDFLAFSLHENLRIPCSVSDTIISLEGIYDIVRKQYYSTKLLERLLDHRAGSHTKLMGIADVDLFIPPLSFVFGEAQFNNPASLISIYRLRQQFYGLPDDPELLLVRSEKEAIHELGHCYGLIHCRDYRCVMYLSYSVEDIDMKTAFFCQKCSDLLGKRL
jgi:archaemetzincin